MNAFLLDEGHARLIGELVGRVLALGMQENEHLAGCSPPEVAVLEARLGRPLPGLYRAYLTAMGHSAGSLFRGIEVEYPRLLAFPEAVEYLLDHIHQRRGRRPFELPADAFVFRFDEGYLFYFFRTAQKDDDPPVWWFSDDWDAPRQHSASFSEYLLQHLESVIEARRRAEALRRMRGASNREA